MVSIGQQTETNNVRRNQRAIPTRGVIVKPKGSAGNGTSPPPLEVPVEYPPMSTTAPISVSEKKIPALPTAPPPPATGKGDDASNLKTEQTSNLTPQQQGNADTKLAPTEQQQGNADKKLAPTEQQQGNADKKLAPTEQQQGDDKAVSGANTPPTTPPANIAPPPPADQPPSSNWGRNIAFGLAAVAIVAGLYFFGPKLYNMAKSAA